MTACSQSQPSQATPQSQETTAAETQAAEGIYTPGTYTATATGFGGEITVSMSFSESEILEVNVTGDKETEGVGSNAVANLPALIVEAQSADVEAVSGATISSKAIMQAAEDCIRQAKGEEKTLSEVKMKPGTYTAYAESFQAGDGLNVSVTVDETKIVSIDVDTENTSDTPTVLQSAIDRLIPRMVEYQSLSIDAVTGATASSNAIKSAAEQAVAEALEAGGSDASAIENFYVSVPQTDKEEVLNTDILVIGMGGSGTAAAVKAAECGAQVLAIDKAGRYGGTTGLTTEGLFVNPPKFQEEHNNGKDYTDADVLYKDWVAYGEGDNKPEIIHRMVYESGQVLDWLNYDHGYKVSEPSTGFTPTDVYVTKYQWLPNDIMYNKDVLGQYFDKLWSDFEELGGTYMLETEGYSLIYDAATNKVTGAKARNVVDGTEYVINAKAVIDATGGYAGNSQMELELLRNDYYPLNGVWKLFGSHQNDGKMMQAAMEIGAGLFNESIPPEVHNSGTEKWITTAFEKNYIEGEVGEETGRPAFWSAGDLPANMGWSADSLAVGADGKRFTSETQVSFLGPWAAGPNYYSIYSSEQIDKLVAEGFDTDRSGPSASFLGSGYQIPMNTPIENAYEVLELAEKEGMVVKADTIEELAEKLNMDPATLRETVDNYNHYCETGVDEEFGKDKSLLDPIGDGPYYGVIMASYCYGTVGGLDINEQFEVLQEDGKTPIEGLYSAGSECIGVLFTEKKAYVTYGGANNGWGWTSGFLCGQEAAKKLGYEVK
jgi:fumarate reductase flavoprotein subunit